jgi:3-hydroxyacyl-CoA dehydrogenase
VCAGDKASGRVPGERYSSLADELCARGWFGQKSKRGWYAYDPAAPRLAIESADTMKLIEEHRAKMVGVYDSFLSLQNYVVVMGDIGMIV